MITKIFELLRFDCTPNLPGIYLEFLVDRPFAHPPKIPGALNKLGVWGPQAPAGSRGNAPVKGPAPLCKAPPTPAKIDFKHFYVLRQHLLECFFFYNNKLAFSPSETRKNKQTKKMLKIYIMFNLYSENTGLGESMDDRALLYA